MEDDRAAEGIEHLQRAAKELVAAARSFLDVVEDVVEDPERFGATASSLVELVRDGLGSVAGHRPDPPWATHARSSSPAADDAPATASSSTRVEAADGTDVDPPEPDRAAADPHGPTQRVRRITVD